jgi:regulator of protease activity HflC (stomatin/prohibitin superfamily)
MMKRGLIVIGVILITGIIIAAFTFYIVEEGEQAVLLRFGKIMDIQTEAGLKFKVPFVDEIRVYPKKLLSWDGAPQEITTEQTEAQFIVVDTTARWYIRDPKKFYESLGYMTEALKKLDDIIDSSVRTVINGNLLTEAIRNSKIPLTFSASDFLNLHSLIIKLKTKSDPVSEYIVSLFPPEVSSMINTYMGAEETVSKPFVDALVKAFNSLLDMPDLYEPYRFQNVLLIEHTKSLLEKEELTPEEQVTLNRLLLEEAYSHEIAISPVKKGRTTLSAEMLDVAREKMLEKDKITGNLLTDASGKPIDQFGIELKDIVLRQIHYSEQLRESVYNRMIQERNQIAEKTRAEGQAEKEKILGALDREVKRLNSEGKMESERIKGEADAYVTKVYADAYKRDPTFFKLWRTLESYKKILPKFKKTFSTDADYFDYLYNSRGR